uniref:Hypothetical conserved protein n=1 Tax=Acetithermum autotrophicum TaxID=1446466 RepID=H5ST44_ACEAU|nr:hypothetical conserved protein [Candidatus Acetothermum autotrophicum]
MALARRSTFLAFLFALIGFIGCTTTGPLIISLTGMPNPLIYPTSALLTVAGSPGSSKGLFTWTFFISCGGTFSSTTLPNNGPGNPLTIGPTSATTVSVTYDPTGASLGPCTLTVKLTTTSGRMATLTTSFTLSTSQPPATKMYWTNFEANKIQRANTDGSGLINLIDTGVSSFLEDLTLDLTNGKIYWTRNGKIQRANLDGSSIEDVVTGVIGPRGIALDLANGKIYWIIGGGIGTGQIQRANIDGSGVETLLSSLSFPIDITLDVTSGKMYWTDFNDGKILRANLDGTNAEDVVSGLQNPYAITLDDLITEKIYWTDDGNGRVQRANLDGSDVTTIADGISCPRGVALDLGTLKIYWTAACSGKVQRADLDGSNVEDLLTGLSILQGPQGIALEP